MTEDNVVDLDVELRDGEYSVGLLDDHKLEYILNGFSEFTHDKYFLVCLSGAISNRQEKTPPFYSGLGISNNIKVPLISFSDPTLRMSDGLGLAWYAGNFKNINVLSVMASLIERVSITAKMQPIIFGGSGGGFAAIGLAHLLKCKSKVLVWNPQTSIAEYDKGHVAKYLEVAFPDYSGQAFYEFLDAKLPIHDLSYKTLPENVELLYLQNASDWHFKKHCIPFFKKQFADDWHRYGNSLFTSADKRLVLFVGDWGRGHAAPSAASISQLIMLLISGESVLTACKRIDGGLVDGLCSYEYIENIKVKSTSPILANLAYGASVVKITVSDTRSTGFQYAYWLLDAEDKKVQVFDFSDSRQAIFDIVEDVKYTVICLRRDPFGYIDRKRFDVFQTESSKRSELIADTQIVSPPFLFGDINFSVVDFKVGEFSIELPVKTSMLISKTFSSLQEKGSLSNFYIDAYENDELRMESFSGVGHSICKHSLLFQEANFLFFEDDVLPFYLVQVRRSVDGFYFPTLDLYYGRNLQSIIIMLKGLISNSGGVGSLNRIGYDKVTASFSGVYAAHPLPYHYFYDVLPAFDDLMQRQNSSDIRVLTDLNRAYLDLARFYPCSVSYIDTREKSGIYWPNGFVISALVDGDFSVGSLRRYDMEPVYQKVINAVLKYNGSDLIKSSYPVIWLGVLSGKRAWVEQADGLVTLIEMISETNPNALFVFDGMTSALGNYSHSKSHADIIMDILENLSCKINLLDLNGATSQEKMAIANVASYFVSEAATASMYPARYAGVTGVAYSAPEARIHTHLHRNTTFFPSNLVRMCNPEKGWQFSDLSIEPKIFADFVYSHFKSTLG